MGRKNENECLQSLKNAILGKTKTDIYCNCDMKIISKYLFGAKENPDANCFPDFVFENGWIEHFEITSSKETKKGSEYKIKEKDNKRAREKYDAIFRDNFLNSDFVSGRVLSNNYEEVYDSFTYADFLKSLKRNTLSHIASLEKSHRDNQIVIFLMEQQTARLWIDEGVTPAKFYELHKDKKALSIIKDICNSINYLIYSVSNSIEIIDLSKIDNLIEGASVYNNIRGGRLINCQINMFIDL